MKKRFIVGLVVSLVSLAGAPLLEAASPTTQAKSNATGSTAVAKTSTHGKKKGKKTHHAVVAKKRTAATPAKGAAKG
ncbi:MAG: hypothetical protein ACXVID_06970 [Thermoanaerobaculia bacterium]